MLDDVCVRRELLFYNLKRLSGFEIQGREGKKAQYGKWREERILFSLSLSLSILPWKLGDSDRTEKERKDTRGREFSPLSC